MPRAHLSRRLVALAASAITAVYAAGYLRTESADSLLAASSPADVTAVMLTQPVPSPTPSTAVTVSVAPTSGAITDQAVEVYADRHHVTWDDARTQMQATAGLPPGGLAATAVPSAANGGSTSATRPDDSSPPRPTVAAAAARTTPIPTPPARTAVGLQPTATPAVPADYKDGTYVGTGTSRRGDVQVSLAIQAGRIASVHITRATTEYPTRLISNLPSEVVARQSAQVDMVSGATYSAQAFRGAVLQALQRAET